jgi:hypothetical protein
MAPYIASVLSPLALLPLVPPVHAEEVKNARYFLKLEVAKVSVKKKVAKAMPRNNSCGATRCAMHDVLWCGVG